MRYLIGIDDTDNQETHGTGRLARDLAGVLNAQRLAEIEGITRHQLLVDPRIRYTSHNSSACLTVITQPDRLATLIQACREFLVKNSAAGSDAGFCLAEMLQAGESIQQFGQQAKHQVLMMADAFALASAASISLEGVTGDRSGVIGALAAVGLRATGEDGRFLWLTGLRELNGIYTADQLLRTTPIERIQTVEGREVPPTDRVDVGEWVRPLLKRGQPLLLVEQAQGSANCEWRVVAKELIKQLSN